MINFESLRFEDWKNMQDKSKKEIADEYFRDNREYVNKCFSNRGHGTYVFTDHGMAWFYDSIRQVDYIKEMIGVLEKQLELPCFVVQYLDQNTPDKEFEWLEESSIKQVGSGGIVFDSSNRNTNAQKDQEEIFYKTNTGITIVRVPRSCTDHTLKFYEDSRAYGCFAEVSERDIERSGVVPRCIKTRTKKLQWDKHGLQIIETPPYEVSVIDFSYFNDLNTRQIMDVVKQIKRKMLMIGHNTLEDFMDELDCR
ncbi:MAG: hypothetical protein HZB65_00085 [Candidatus Aenigmarchaeota archaeon]|nr:hypothetical protein [Candidatus Aenigmarchaeota archaeon]